MLVYALRHPARGADREMERFGLPMLRPSVRARRTVAEFLFLFDARARGGYDTGASRGHGAAWRISFPKTP